MKQSIFVIEQMDCPTEEKLLRHRLGTIAGVERLDFDLMARRLTVHHQLDGDGELVSAIESLGMKPQPTTDARQAPSAAAPPGRLREWLLLGVAGVAALAAEVVAWSTGNEASAVVIGLAVLSIVAGGRQTLRKGLIALRNLTLNINFLMTIAIAGAVAIGQWPEAAMVTFLFALAEEIERYSLDRARNAVRALMELTPETASARTEGGQWREVDAKIVQIGQIVRVRPGERVPLDGVVTVGASSVNQAPITGESMPVEKKVGDPVFAGTINERGAFEVRVTAAQGGTTLARIVRSIQEAQAERAPTQRFVDRFSRWYTPAVVAFAVLAATVPPLAFGAPFQPWLYKALVLLVIACPCALVISTPVTVVSGLARAAKLGILVKGGVYLETGRKLRVVALDKTGTLTHGRPAVTDIVPLDGGTPEAALKLAASLDTHSEHPVASAIVARWTADGGGDVSPVTDFESITGRGVKGRVEGTLYYVGNHRLAEEMGVCSPQVEAELKRLEQEGKTTVVVMSERHAVAVLAVADTLRNTSIEAVRQMHALGMRTVLLTGDNAITAQAIGTSVGIDDVRGNLLPEDKLTAVGELRAAHGPIGMVGDGINDAPALAKADIGFAMGAAGTDTALETADVALMQDDLRRLPLFVRLSRRTGQVLAWNIALAIGIKAVFFGLALFDFATLWMAVFADMGASLIVVFSGLSLLRFERAETT